MNPEQQLIAIAEACGWRCTAAFKEAIALWVRPNGMDHETEFIPDYLHDLNAMHEAEEMLDCNQWEVWHRIVGEWPTELARLTASQRAEAFLRTIGKWEEAKP